jgi:hypothetical protein
VETEKLVVVRHAIVKPNRRDELIERFHKIVAMDEAKEPGTIVQSFQFERDNPNAFWEYLVYANAEARSIHLQHLEEMGHIAQTKDIYEDRGTSVACTPLCAKGIDVK